MDNQAPPIPPIQVEEHEKKKLDTLAFKRFIANFLIPITALIISALLFIFVILPSINEIPLLRADLNEKQALVDQLDAKLLKLRNLTDFKGSVDENNELLSTVLVEEPLVPQLLTQIDRIAGESGVTITKINYATSENTGPADPNAEVVKPPYNVVTINVGSDSTYDQIVTFLSNLENAGRVVDINSIRFNTLEDEERSGIFSSSFVISSPYVKVETSAVTDDPISFDLANAQFQNLMSKLKALKIYDISIDEVIDIQNLPNDATNEDEEPTEVSDIEESEIMPEQPEPVF